MAKSRPRSDDGNKPEATPVDLSKFGSLFADRDAIREALAKNRAEGKYLARLLKLVDQAQGGTPTDLRTVPSNDLVGDPVMDIKAGE